MKVTESGGQKELMKALSAGLRDSNRMRQQKHALPPHIMAYAQALVNLEGVTTDKANLSREQAGTALKTAAEAAHISDTDITTYMDEFRRIRNQQRDAARQ